MEKDSAGNYNYREGEAPTVNSSSAVWSATTAFGWALVDDGAKVEWGRFNVDFSSTLANSVLSVVPISTAPYDGDLVTPSPSSSFILTDDVIQDETIFDAPISLEKMADVDIGDGDNLLDGRIILVLDGVSKKFVSTYRTMEFLRQHSS